MGYKGFLRGVNSSLNRMERESRRAQKEQDRRIKQLEKMEALERASFEVEEYNNYLKLIQSMHKNCNNQIDWNEICNLEEPIKPKASDYREKTAIKKKESYSPGFFDRLFKLESKRIKKLENDILEAKVIDEKENRYDLNKYEKEYEEWKKSTDIASRVLNGEENAYYEAIKEVSPFNKIDNIGSSIGYNFVNKDFVECGLNLFKDVIPKEEKKLLKSGKLSVKELSSSKYNTIYQDHVCSAVLRVAREMFAFLPINKVIVSAIIEAVNTSTGNLEDTTILSVFIPKETIKTINFDLIDPSDCMSNFVHNMDFKKTKGFSKVEEIDSKKYS